MRFYPRPFTRRRARGFTEKNHARYRANGFGIWVIEERGSVEREAVFHVLPHLVLVRTPR